MAIGVLDGDQHSLMHELESSFRVLFWIRIHFNGPNESRIVPRFSSWNLADARELAISKTGLISNNDD